MKTRFASVWNATPETPVPHALGRSERLAWLALEGFPRLAADTLLDSANKGRVSSVVRDAIGQLGSAVPNGPASRVRCYAALVESGLNLAGMERKRAGFSDEEAVMAFDDIVGVLRKWEAEAGGADGAAVTVTQAMLSEMRKVLMGQSMVAKMAEEIAKELKDGDLLGSFLLAARRVVQENVYFSIADAGLSKVGNDSATGLRWLRHLGAVQVSSNPVIAARAFDETPELWQRFEAVAAAHPEWRGDPEGYADEVAMFATVTSLLPNVLDFRPVALLSDFRDGMVSIQLNPFKAGSTEGSREDALKIFGILREILRAYDAFLCPDADVDGRPNVVFKVATSGPAAIETTRRLNEMGIGTNDTVTFTAAQEVSAALAAAVGIARALESGGPVGRVYVTNMEGRLEDHLRESEAARILLERVEHAGDPEAVLSSVAKGRGAEDEMRKGGTLEERVTTLCTKKHLKSLEDGWFVEAVGRENASALAGAEKAIRMSGITITRRVFALVFAPEVTPKLRAYVKKEAGVSEEQARLALGLVDLLPASKRRAEDTVLVLGTLEVENLTNTDFPDQQLRVWSKAREGGFRVSDYEGSISAKADGSSLERLMGIEDFRKAYLLTHELAAVLSGLGIDAGEAGGLGPEGWSSYGPVRKTMQEFEGAYTSFRSRLVGSLGGPESPD